MSHLFQDSDDIEVIVDDVVVWEQVVEQDDVCVRQVWTVVADTTSGLTEKTPFLYMCLKRVMWFTC